MSNSKKTKDLDVIGTNYTRIDAEAKVTGRAEYAGDISVKDNST